MTHYLPAVGLLAAVAMVVVFVGTLLIREDATTADGTAAPERNERGAISAAAFLGGQSNELARYQEAREDLVRVVGRLRQVSSLIVDPDTASLTLDRIEGLDDHDLLSATIKSPAPGTDALLERIGRNGRITLEGCARNTPLHDPGSAHARDPADQRARRPRD